MKFPENATTAERAIEWQKLAEIKDADFGFYDLREQNDEVRYCARVVLWNEVGEIRVIRSKLGYLQLPGGGIDDGESIEEALRREAREEAGYSIKDIRPLGYVFERHESVRHISSYNIAMNYIYEAWADKEVGTSLTDGELADGYEAVWMKPEDFVAEQEKCRPESYGGHFSHKRDLLVVRHCCLHE